MAPSLTGSDQFFLTYEALQSHANTQLPEHDVLLDLGLDREDTTPSSVEDTLDLAGTRKRKISQVDDYPQGDLASRRFKPSTAAPPSSEVAESPAEENDHRNEEEEGHGEASHEPEAAGQASAMIPKAQEYKGDGVACGNGIILVSDERGLPMIRTVAAEHESEVGCECDERLENTLNRLGICLEGTEHQAVYIWTATKVVELFRKSIAFILAVDGQSDEILCPMHIEVLERLFKIPKARTQELTDWLDKLSEVVQDIREAILPPAPVIPFTTQANAEKLGGIYDPSSPAIEPSTKLVDAITSWNEAGFHTFKDGAQHLFTSVVGKLAEEEGEIIRHVSDRKSYRLHQHTYTPMQQMIQQDVRLYQAATRLHSEGHIAMITQPICPILFDGTEMSFTEGDFELAAATGVGLEHMDLYLAADPTGRTGNFTMTTVNAADHVNEIGHHVQGLLPESQDDGARDFVWSEVTKVLSQITASTVTRTQEKDVELVQGNACYVKTTSLITIRAMTDADAAKLKDTPAIIYRVRYIPAYGDQSVDLMTRDLKGQFHINERTMTYEVRDWHDHLSLPHRPFNSDPVAMFQNPSSISLMLRGGYHTLNYPLYEHLRSIHQPHQSKDGHDSSEKPEVILARLRTAYVQNVIRDINEKGGTSFHVAKIYNNHWSPGGPLNLSDSSDDLTEEQKILLKNDPESYGRKLDAYVYFDPELHCALGGLLNDKKIIDSFPETFRWFRGRITESTELLKAAIARMTPIPAKAQL